MPTRKRLRRAAASLTADKVLEMCTGEVGYFQGHLYSGYATDGSTELEDYINAVRNDWARFGPDLLPWLVRGAGEAMRPPYLGRPGPAPWDLYCCSFPGARPWAWWRLDSPEPLLDETQFDYLRRLDLLLPGEEVAVARYTAKRRSDRLESIIHEAERSLGRRPGRSGPKLDDPGKARDELNVATAELSALQPLLDEIGPGRCGYWDGFDQD